ncbi:MAG: 4Fe-4S binding protein [Campylobacteraceae bacterium]|jgi:2-oxoglutarate ferredoxin oxidoreductase subunit delta|nr:4Fe-4S binding protein [Campylobacteraceae bacterium]
MSFLTPPEDKALVWVDISRCKACDICVSLCPSGTLAMVQNVHFTQGKTIEVVEPDSCIGCRDCELHCPDFAIFVAERSSEVKFAKLTEESKARALAIKNNKFNKVGA